MPEYKDMFCPKVVEDMLERERVRFRKMAGPLPTVNSLTCFFLKPAPVAC